jgi:hypothetical protein
VIANNTVVTFAEDAATSDVAIRRAIADLAEPGALDVERAMPFVPDRARARLSKFQACLPEPVEREFLAERIFDLEGARETVRDAGGGAWRGA